MLIDFRERKGAVRERERITGVREKHWWVASHSRPEVGLNPQPRCVPDGESNLQPFGV